MKKIDPNSLVAIFLILIIILLFLVSYANYQRESPRESHPGSWTRIKVPGGWVYGRYQYGAAFVVDKNVKYEELENLDAIKD